MPQHHARRLAWFAPLPPVRSGIAQYNAELLPGLASAYSVELFVDAHPDQFVRPDARIRLYSAHDFVWKHLRQPYDLIVYQLGNAPCHDYMWAYMARYPGLVVLHDGQLHHARGRGLLEQKRADDYRSEFAFNHPGVQLAIAELGIAGLLGSLTYLWPMRRVVIESARMIAVHNQWLADQIREEHPDAQVTVLDMGVPAPALPADAGPIIRARHGIQRDTVLFLALGDVTPEKRISQAIRGLASLVHARPPATPVPNVHLLLAGKTVDHYDAEAEARALGVADRVTVAGFVPHEDVAAYVDAADVCLCMRWPSSRETSAAWLRCLAAARPTVTTDLVHMVDIPAYDPRAWTILHAPAGAGKTMPLASEPACVSVDIIDEDHSLRLAMRRLASDPRLRATLGRRARQLWLERFTLDRMVAEYLDLLDAACTSPIPGRARLAQLPAHFGTRGTEHATRLLREMDWPASRITEVWRGQV